MINDAMFNSIDPSYKEQLLKEMKEIRLQKGEFLFWQETEATHVYFVKSGNLKVFKTSVNGNETIFDIYDQSMYIALGVLFNQPQRYPASCSAVDDAVVNALPVKLVEEAIVSNPESARRWIAYTNKRLTMVQRKLSEQIFSDSAERFRKLVRYFKSKYSFKEVDGQFIISVPITKQVIADILNVRRETFSRMLSTLKEQGLCDVVNKKIIANIEWLQKD